MNAKKCVLAYSGGLDTSAMVPWLLDHDYEVHAVLVDVGQEEDLDALCEKAVRYGAATATVRDAKPAMFEQIIPLAIGLAATYEGTYRLGTALARPFIGAAQVAVAQALGGATLCHGATGKGNDQIRFEFAYRSLAPDYPILAPWKVWDFGGRVDLIKYLQGKGYIDNYALTKEYSLDENLWHLSIEGGPLEDPNALVDVNAVLGMVDGRFAWQHTYGPGSSSVELAFENGVPVALNGRAKPLAEIVAQLNHQYRQEPWAWDLIIENRFTGIKSRGLYINPAAKLLHGAVEALARTTLNKPTYDQWARLGQEFGTMIYRGEFFSDQRRVLEAAARAAMAQLNGVVTMQLEPVLYAAKIATTKSIFTKKLATFEKSEYAHGDAAGFIRLSWLANIGKPFSEDGDGAVEAKSRAASDLCPAKSVHSGRLVPSAV